jgi:hypothetical protein
MIWTQSGPKAYTLILMCLGQSNRYLPKPAASMDLQAGVVEGADRGSDATGNSTLTVGVDQGVSGVRATSVDEHRTSL